MSVIKKPDLKIFAQDAKTGEIETFPDVLRGWGITLDKTAGKPPLEWFNAIGKRVDEWLMYLTQRGVAEWDAALSYPKTAIVQWNGVIYVSNKETKGEQPDKSQAAWSTLGVFLGLGNYYTKTDTDTKFQLKGNYALKGESYTKVESDTRFQPKGNYLPSGYSYSKSESDTKYQPKGNYAPAGDYATNTALLSGLNSKLDKASVVQGTGTSTTQVISQNGVSKALASKADSKVFIAATEIGSSAITPPEGSGSLVISKSGGFYVFVPSAGHVFKVNAEGVLERGVVPYSNVSGAPLLGVGQKWKTVTKQINVLYTNTTQKPIFVFAKSNASFNNFKVELEVDGVIASSIMVNGSGGDGTVTKELSCGAIVPSQSSYKFLVGGVEPAGVSISYAAELS
ncbi:hypothetical protein NMC40_18740 [Proteus mirabilis]|uniref:hypothetical protein n=1 Tax=Proteus mirabilis TaxID=584 RepID=UPI0021BF7ECE|nr:hypothetical protein [Proteus mirabilis]MCT9020842.1 hypothetical protein [Proteus mirabilis]